MRNEIKTEEKIESEDNSIEDSEFLEFTRNSIVSILKLWSSKKEQLEYQESDPSINVSSELFEQWNDFYTSDSEVLTEAFTPKQLNQLEKFDTELTIRSNPSNNALPNIIEYMKTEDWKVLNSLSIELLSDFEKM